MSTDQDSSRLRMKSAIEPRDGTGTCPMCEGRDIVIQASIDPAVLRRLYQDSLSIDVSTYFHGIPQLAIAKCQSCDLRFFVPAIAGDGDFYARLRERDWYYIKEKQEFSVAAAEISGADDVLDVGCGDGNFFNHIKPRSYLGLELSASAACEAKSRGIDVREMTIEAYAEQHPRSMDVVCAFQVLEHIPTPRPFLQAAIKCLRPGGRLIVSVPSATSFLGQAINNILNCPPHHVTWWSDDALRSIERTHGVRLVRTYNDVLADEHVEAYLNTLVIRGLDVRKRRIGVIDGSTRLRVFSKIASMLMPILKAGLAPREMRPRGHSTTVVFVAD